MRTTEGRPRNVAGQWSHFSESISAVFSVSQELLSYVFADGFNHLAYLGSANHVVLNDMMALQLDIQRHSDAWEVIHQMSCHHKPPIPWPARNHDFMHYVLIAFSSTSLFLAFLRRGSNVLEPRDQTNPLVYAAHFGKAQHAQMLLSRGANVNERGLIVDASRQALPLEIAVGRRHDALVDILLSAGSMVPKRLFALSTYYFKFPVHVVRRLLETDQFVEWAAEPGNKLASPLRILERRPSLVYEADTLSIIRRLVQVGVDPTEHDSAQRTTLYFAILGGYQAIAGYLLLAGAPFSPDFISVVSRTTPSKRIPVLRSIVEAGADIHARVAGGDTTLHLAIRFFQDDCLEAVKILVDAGCNPFARNAADKTSLHLALEKGFLSVADYLLSQGTPPLDALLAVVESECPSTWRLEALRALVNRGVDINALLPREMVSLETGYANTSGETPLDLVMDHNSSFRDHLLSTGRCPPDALFAVLRSDLPTSWKTLTICSLVGRGADLRGLSADENILLYATVLALDKHQGLDMVKLLVGAGWDPFSRSVDGKTLFHIALDRNLLEIVHYLLSTGKPLPPDALFAILHSALPADWRAQTIRSLVGKGADVCGLSADGNTLLHATVLSLDSSQALDVTKFLVGAGCDPFSRNADSKTPLHIALDRKLPGIADYLVSTGKPLPPDAPFAILHSALPADWRAQTIRSLVGKGVDMCGLSADGNTLLHATVLSLDSSWALDVTNLLVGAGCDPSVCNRQGKKALHIAVEKGLVSVMEYILSLDESLPDDILSSALKSSSSSQVPILRTLLSKGANTSVVAVDGNNLLHVAISSPPNRFWDVRAVVETLVGGGCDAFLSNSQGKTPLHLAVAKGYASTVEYLLSIATPPSLPADILVCAVGAEGARTDSKDTCDMLRLLIDKGADMHVQAADGGTLLHTAIKNRRWLRTPHIQSTIPRPPTGTFQPEGTPSNWIADVALLDIIEFLVSVGCDPSQCDADGDPPVYFAVLEGHIRVVEYLLLITSPLPWSLLDAVQLAPHEVRDELSCLLMNVLL